MIPAHATARREGTESRVREAELLDLRFRNLFPEADWAGPSPAIRRRFSKRLRPGASAVYVGSVVETRMSRLGRIPAQAARLVGAPLPLSRIGSGRQWLWRVGRYDLVRPICDAIATPSLEGPLNAVAPEPDRNADFAATPGTPARPSGTSSPSRLAAAAAGLPLR